MIAMENMRLQAPAKLNLSLNVFPERLERGFYRVNFINVQTSLHDTVTLRFTKEGPVSMQMGGVDGERDLACRAARLVKERCGIEQGVSITLDKRIPLRAGLGGGSADAASVINGMDRALSLEIPLTEKIALAGKLGMDVCYCVVGGLCSVSGIGDRVEKITAPPIHASVLVATPPETKPSTAWAYSVLDSGRIGKREDLIKELLRGLESGDIALAARSMHNDFEYPVGLHYPIVRTLKETMLESGALGAILAGSGLSVFGIFGTDEEARAAEAELAGNKIRCSITRISV